MVAQAGQTEILMKVIGQMENLMSLVHTVGLMDENTSVIGNKAKRMDMGRTLGQMAESTKVIGRTTKCMGLEHLYG